MNGKQEGNSGKKHAGIRLGRMNVVLILAGLVIAALMVFSTYRTTESVKEIVTTTDLYLNNQQTAGMLGDFAENLAEQAMAFVQAGEPGPARAYEAQLNVINARLEQYGPETSTSQAANMAMLEAVAAFRALNGAEARAMRLAAENMPQPAFAALPDFLKQEALSEEDQALSPEERKAAALALLTSEEYTAYGETIREAVDSSHRLSSEEGTQQAEKTFDRVRGIIELQKVMIYLFIAIAAAALVINRLLIIAPIQKSIGNLDRREPIPEQGSYEMRHLARVYNEMLKDNEEKAKALTYTASHDALTDLLNRAAFDKAYKEESGGQVAVVIADVDHFKQYNDEYGHDIGDRVLQMAAEALKRNFRAEDRIFRIGGDEFCIMMPGICQNRAESIREKIIRINRELKQEGAGLPPVTLSAGIACWDRPNPGKSILKDADLVLLELKKTRETCCMVYPG